MRFFNDFGFSSYCSESLELSSLKCEFLNFLYGFGFVMESLDSRLSTQDVLMTLGFVCILQKI